MNGWKRRFFFISGDDWEFSLNLAWGEGVPRVPRTWGTPGKHCNKLPILTDIEDQRTKKYFAVDRKRISSSDGHNVEGKSVDGATASTGNEGRNDSIGLGLFSLRSSLGSKSESCNVEKDHLKEARLEGGGIQGRKLVVEVNPGYKRGKIVNDTQCAGDQKNLTNSASWEGTSVNPGNALGPGVSMLGSASVAEKILSRVILPADKEKVNKLSLDQVVTTLFHIVDQNQTLELEGLLGEFSEQEQKATKELKEKIEAVARLEAEVAELKKNEALAKGKAIEEYKSLDDFQEAVESAASKYSDDMGLDHDLIEEEEEEGEDKEKEEN
ncbi:hypothetical protein Acr_28g0004960 [Actinidia rufa]|uniref:Uncharacterized protein n=1 Tax=Actinidia rufa TaxID=165716 RepID=A0A7J0HA08_9ERIC|nr:hypothetical protein Acr_28g0004960 [Actinidia rufa]